MGVCLFVWRVDMGLVNFLLKNRKPYGKALTAKLLFHCRLSRETGHLSLPLFDGIQPVFISVCKMGLFVVFICVCPLRSRSRRQPGSRLRRRWPTRYKQTRPKQPISAPPTSSTRMRCIASNGTVRKTSVDW